MSRVDDEILPLYRAARFAFLRGDVADAEQTYRILRTVYAIDLYYEIDLPQHVLFVHPLGSVLGRARYGDYLTVYQQVGVGSDVDGNRPRIGNWAVLFPGCKVLGNTTIGDNVFVTANAVMQNVQVPSGSVAFGYNQWKPTRRSARQTMWKHFHPAAPCPVE